MLFKISPFMIHIRTFAKKNWSEYLQKQMQQRNDTMNMSPSVSISTFKFIAEKLCDFTDFHLNRLSSCVFVGIYLYWWLIYFKTWLPTSNVGRSHICHTCLHESSVSSLLDNCLHKKVSCSSSITPHPTLYYLASKWALDISEKEWYK